MDSGKLYKVIYAKRLEAPSRTRQANTTKNFLNERADRDDGLLSESRQEGFAVASRAAHARALDTCLSTQNAKLWLLMPPSVASIVENFQAHGIMQEIRWRYMDYGKLAQRAAIAFRDVLTLLLVNEYESFDEALLDIAIQTNLPPDAVNWVASHFVPYIDGWHGAAYYMH